MYRLFRKIFRQREKVCNGPVFEAGEIEAGLEKERKNMNHNIDNVNIAGIAWTL